MEPTVTLALTGQLTLHVLSQLDASSITASQAAVLLGMSVRQIRRKLKAYRERAAASIPHGSRGRKPPNAIPEALAARVVELAQSD
jgi:Bacterial regulatory protein, Fis family